jgi:hypothetical protein
MVVAAQGVRVEAALTTGFSIPTSRLGVSVERSGGCGGTVVVFAMFADVPARRPALSVAAGNSSAAVTVNSTVVQVNSTALAIESAACTFTSGVVVPIIKRVAAGVVRVVVIDHGSVMPIGSPMMPAPSITSEPTDSEADSGREIRTVIPDPGIRVPSRPRY